MRTPIVSDRVEQRIQRKPIWQSIAIGFCLGAFNPCMSETLGPPPVTPNEEFFELGFPEPVPDDWMLLVDGDVEQPLSLLLDDIKQYPITTEMSTLECYYPIGPFLLVSNANWTGIRLNDVLDDVIPAPDAKSITFHAFDGYRRGPLPLDEIRERDDILLSYAMNGETLSSIQGHPLKLVMPGMGGNMHVRWLERITISTSEPTRELLHYPIHARIFEPEFMDTLTPGSYTIGGMAHAGEGIEITQVEISTDHGQTWAPATLRNDFIPNVWILWEYTWEIPQAGEFEIFARTVDSQGNPQLDGNYVPFSWEGFGVPVIVEDDLDGDRVPDSTDNCIDVYNPSQADADGDGIGNPCDPDCPNLDTLPVINFQDYASLTADWQQSGTGLLGDLNGDGVVDAFDLMILSRYWLTECQP